MPNKNTVNDCSILDMRKFPCVEKNTITLEKNINIPFSVKRVYYLYNIPKGAKRGGHAHYQLEQYIIAAYGSFNVILDDGINKRVFTLNKPYMALHIVPGLWRELSDFSPKTTVMVLASDLYDEKDYIRNYDKFINEKKISNKHSLF